MTQVIQNIKTGDIIKFYERSKQNIKYGKSLAQQTREKK